MKHKVKWVPGLGARGHKGEYVHFKTKGKAYYSTPNWPWLVKTVKRTKIVVRWWTGPSGHEGQWNTQEFLPGDLAAARIVAKQIAEQIPYDVRVYGEGYVYSSHRKEMDIMNIFDFGQWEPEGGVRVNPSKRGLVLWRYDKVIGTWKYERSVEPDTAEQWLGVFQRDEPDAVFKISKNQPRTAVEKELRALSKRARGKTSKKRANPRKKATNVRSLVSKALR